MTAEELIRNASVNGAAAALNGGSLLLREGTTTRLTFALKATAFLAASGGSALLDVASPDMTATAVSSATVALDNYQFRTSADALALSGDVGALESGAEIEMNHPNVVIGDVVDMVDYELTQPAAA